MYTMTTRTLAVAFAAGTFAITAGTACSDSDAAPTVTEPDAVNATSSRSTDPVDRVDRDATVGEVEGDPAVGSDSLLPTGHAVGVRDELMRLAESAPFGTGSGPDFAIIQNWFDRYPAMERSFFDDQDATTTMVSSSSAFLIENVTAPGDQAFAWAVLDTAGVCAAAVAIIPGNADGSVSDSGAPTVFVPVNDLTTCTARAAIDELTTA